MGRGSSRVDWFEVVSAVLGAIFFALSAICLVAFVTVLLSWNSREVSPTFGTGFLRGLKGLAVVFFPIAALVTFATGWWLAGDLIRRWYRGIRERDE